MTAPADLAAMLGKGGYVLVYRRQRDNACPGCGRSNWIVGRSTAECAFCHTALPLAEPVEPENSIATQTERNH